MTVDVVIPAYNEERDQLLRTVTACLSQSLPVRRVIVVDDASQEPVTLDHLGEKVVVHRLDANGGISRARNRGIALSNANAVACVNVEVEIGRDWIEKLVALISENPRIGACAGRIRTNDSRRTLSNWRLRFQEAPYERSAGTHSIEFATGHAVMFRRSAVEIIGGYNERIASTGEDADICSRLADAGWMTVVVDGVYAVSLRRDTVELLAMKELRHSGWST